MHVGGSVPDVLGCVNYVKSCRVPSGGFAAEPGGKPDVITTAIGLMAASELKIADSDMIKAAIAYLGKNAEVVRGSQDGHRRPRSHRIRLARLPAVARADRTRCANPDGTFGTGRQQGVTPPAAPPPRSCAWG